MSFQIKINKNYIYIFLYDLLFAYSFFMLIFDKIVKTNISVPIYLGLGLFAVSGFHKYSLKIKKTGSKNIWFIIFELISMVLLCVSLSCIYNYDFIHTKDSWWFFLVFLSYITGELIYRFENYDSLKEEQNSDLFNIFKNKKSSDESHETDEKDKP